ncbi:hypothetical protein CDR19_25430 [Ectopseudomonas toyotomiensis]|uniref:Uncharacterized protein n=1 Tax=Ectopseudomonas toyotomiensis TaxID=554344 RepID=A0A1I5M392_9GAMM|nr:hypothetical protein [Pseudomonas toyotomiensis]PIA66158.1 hypothetical protein CDR19_25430 [Pseudomonas toyotomiensis]SFP03999.1 hypothetical protein SAMN05216177_1017 [Pseudomonas toyotomiensis]SFP97468.1 hypothetical protein SAMN05216177_106369 [Pseudomonas toyotomiensis]
MATNTTVEVFVHLDHSGYRTKTIKGKKASCTYDAKLAVERLADKLFPDFHKTIERQPCSPVGRLHSKWLIVPGEAIR